MIRVLVIADSGDVLAGITGALCRIPRVDIVAYASGRAHVDAIVRALAPDVVMVDEMCWPGLALRRVGEVRRACSEAAVVGLVERPDAGWIVEGLRAGAAAVIPRDLEPGTLSMVLSDVLATRAAPDPLAPRARSAA